MQNFVTGRHASVTEAHLSIVAENQYRLVAWINYPYRVVYVRFVGTHAEYDRIDAQVI